MVHGIPNCCIILLVIGSLIFLGDYANGAKTKKSKQLDIGNAKFDNTSGVVGSGAQSSVNHPHVLRGNIGKQSPFGLDQGAPDLQFGLALTVPFVTLTTEKLIHGVTSLLGGGGGGNPGFRSFTDLLSAVNLNIGGLVLVAVVGISALLLIVPVLFRNQGVLKGFGSNLFENIVSGGLGGGLNKHFGYGQYDTGHYDAFGGSDGWNKHITSTPYGFQRKEGRGRGRSIPDSPTSSSNITNSFWSTIQSNLLDNWSEIETCGLYAMCIRGKESNSTDSYIRKLSDLNPYLKQMEKAYLLGQSNPSVDCAKEFPKCERVPKFLDSVGSFLFS